MVAHFSNPGYKPVLDEALDYMYLNPGVQAGTTKVFTLLGQIYILSGEGMEAGTTMA